MFEALFPLWGALVLSLLISQVKISTQEVKALAENHTAEAWCSAGTSATLAWKQAIWSPHAMFTTPSLEGVFQPLSPNLLVKIKSPCL